jgi:hypothetical protein
MRGRSWLAVIPIAAKNFVHKCDATVTPSSTMMNEGETKIFTADCLDQFGNSVASADASWNVSSGGGLIDTTGCYTAPAAPELCVVTAKVTLGSGGPSIDITGDATIIVNDPAPTVSTATAADNLLRTNLSIASRLLAPPFRGSKFLTESPSSLVHEIL